ncbi:hypothetical protein Fcan01_23165 [Folsomia candida]|uniref:Uncharacterized protein n=1 Tax=Folsomia candida TaxID=158441 RepID=A0A226DBP3_FOLCA|nr:hypothetical protein Fcan01_23165 [Folsomia candida]
MLAKYSLYFALFTFLCGKLPAQLTTLSLAPNNSIFNILVNLAQLNDTVWELALFNNLLDYNSRPKLIHNMSNFDVYDSKRYMTCGYKLYTGPKITLRYSQEIFFVIPSASKWLATVKFYHVQLQIASCGANPSLIFLIDRSATSTSVIPNGHRLVSLTARLFVLGPNKLGLINMYVFCHTCGSNLLRWIDHNHPDSLKQWKLYNYNLNGMQVWMGWAHENNRNQNTCASLYYSSRSFRSLIICLRKTLSKLYNFTDCYNYPLPHNLHYVSHNSILSSSSHLGNHPWKDSLFIYHIRMLRTSLTAISLKPSSLVESFGTFLIPFDTPTWIGIIVSVLAIPAVIAITKLGSVTHQYATALFWAYACLCGQYGVTNDILRMRPPLKIFIVTSIWFFFFIGTEFYQGSLFSSLITTSPPELPTSTSALLDLKLQIITTGGYYNGTSELQLSTVMYMIRDSIYKPDNTKKLNTMLTQLRHSIMFIPTENSFMLAAQLANLQTFDFNRSIRKLEDTFAILDESPRDENFISGLRTKRKL